MSVERIEIFVVKWPVALVLTVCIKYFRVVQAPNRKLRETRYQEVCGRLGHQNHVTGRVGSGNRLRDGSIGITPLKHRIVTTFPGRWPGPSEGSCSPVIVHEKCA